MSLSADDTTQPVILRDSTRWQIWAVGCLLFTFATVIFLLISIFPSLRDALAGPSSGTAGKWVVRLVALSATSWLVAVYASLMRCTAPPCGPGPVTVEKRFVRRGPDGNPLMHDEKDAWGRLRPIGNLECAGLTFQAIFFAVALILMAFK